MQKTQKSKQAIKKKFEKILEESYVDANEIIKEPPVALSKGLTQSGEHIPIGTYGNFSFIAAVCARIATFNSSISPKSRIRG